MILLLSIYSSTSSAQTKFKYRAGLPAVDSSAFYLINLLPGVVAKTQPGFSDLRIIDKKGKTVPYILSDELPGKDKLHYIRFPKLTDTFNADTGTVFIADNRDAIRTAELWLTLQNTAVNRTVNVLGSDDLKNWYAIKENVLLEEAGGNAQDTYRQMLRLPSSSYRYFKILVNDRNKAPIKILDAGVYQQQSFSQNFVALPAPAVRQTDSAGISHIYIAFNGNYLVNKLVLKISGPPFFKRRLAAYQIDGESMNLLTETNVSSAQHENSIYFNAKGNRIELRIHNQDNAPLIVQSVKAYQQKQAVVSYLNNGERYQLLFGNKEVQAPDYDIKFFVDSIHGALPEISSAKIAANAFIKKPTPQSRFSSAWLLWPAIGLVLLVLLYFTWKMTQEVNNKSAE